MRIVLGSNALVGSASANKRLIREKRTIGSKSSDAPEFSATEPKFGDFAEHRAQKKQHAAKCLWAIMLQLFFADFRRFHVHSSHHLALAGSSAQSAAQNKGKL